MSTAVQYLHKLINSPKLMRNRLHYHLSRKATAPAIWDQEKQAFWEENGYVVFEGLYNDSQIQAINRCVDDIWTKKRIPSPRITADAYIGSSREHRVFIDQLEIEAREQPYKLNDLFLVSDEALGLILGDDLSTILADILEDVPIVCNTLSLEYGSQQDYHTDTLYMPAITGVSGSDYHCNMAASWIALEDCEPDAGLLQYYPGSHKIPPFYFSNGQLAADLDEFGRYEAYMAEQIEERGLESVTFQAKKGDVLLWHELLFHGGSEILDTRKTRKSLVTHYFRTSDVPEINRQRSKAGFYLNRLPHQAPG